MKAFRDTFEFILTDIEDLIQDPSRMKPHLTQFQTFFVCCPSLHTDALCVQTNYLLYGVVLDVLQRIVLCSRCKMRLVPVFTREMHHQRTKTVCPSSSTWFIRRKHKDYHRVSCFPRDMLSA